MTTTPTAASGSGFWSWSPVSNSNPLDKPTPALSDGVWTINNSNYPNPYVTSYGTGTEGIDCSDLTSLAYNVAAGIRISSGVGVQGLVNPAGNGGTGSYANTDSAIFWNTTGAVIDQPNVSTAPDGAVAITPRFFFPTNSAGQPTNLGFNSTASTPYNYINTFNAPGSLNSIINRLQPGDLLYIVGKQ